MCLILVESFFIWTYRCCWNERYREVNFNTQCCIAIFQTSSLPAFCGFHFHPINSFSFLSFQYCFFCHDCCLSVIYSFFSSLFWYSYHHLFMWWHLMIAMMSLWIIFFCAFQCCWLDGWIVQNNLTKNFWFINPVTPFQFVQFILPYCHDYTLSFFILLFSWDKKTIIDIIILL